MNTRPPHHPNCIVVYRRRLREWFRKTYWAACIYCDDCWGPHRTDIAALAEARSLNDATARAIEAGLRP